MRYHQDDRAERFCDIFPELPGDVNVFILAPGQVSAWHRHQRQTDRFFVVQGVITFGMHVHDQPDVFFQRHGPARDIITVRPGVWHGYKNTGDTPAILLMHLNQKYNPDDEERMPPDAFGGWR